MGFTGSFPWTLVHMGLVCIRLVKLTLLRIGVFSRSTRWQLSARRCDYVVLTRSANAPHRGWNPQTLCLFLMCLSVWNNSQLQRVETSAAVSVFSLLISREHVAHWERGQSGCFGQKQLLGLYLCRYPVKPDLLGIFFLEIYFQALPWSATLDPPTYVIWFQPHVNCSSSVSGSSYLSIWVPLALAITSKHTQWLSLCRSVPVFLFLGFSCV